MVTPETRHTGDTPALPIAPGAAPIWVALSGGVDSAVAALLLRRAGQPVRALFMKNWEEDDAPGHCAAAADLADARRACETLGIALDTVNFSSEYWERVFTSMLAELGATRTPNPDVLCNREIKFRACLEHAVERGARGMATGHYARVERRGGRHRLLTARDTDKDQTYFLHLLGQDELARVRFPLGALRKGEVRAIARAAGLGVHDKKDSTGICFVGERPYRAFLQRWIAPCPGAIETPRGRRLGTHEGLAYYTIGQRQGLGIGGLRDAGAGPWYVAGKDAARNALVVVQGRDHPALRAARLRTGPAHWIAGSPPAAEFDCRARIRHRQAPQECTVRVEAGGECRVRFRRPQWAPAPGQSAVFYAGEECLGGGVIEEAG